VHGGGNCKRKVKYNKNLQFTGSDVISTVKRQESTDAEKATIA